MTKCKSCGRIIHLGLLGMIYEGIKEVNEKIKRKEEKQKALEEKFNKEDITLKVGESQEIPHSIKSYGGKIIYKNIENSKIIIDCKIGWFTRTFKFPESSKEINPNKILFSVEEITPEIITLKYLRHYN